MRASAELVRALALAARGPRGAAFADGRHIHVAIEPAETFAEHDAVRALEGFSAAVDAWSTPGTDAGPHAFGWLAYDALRTDEPGAVHDTRPRADRAPLAYLARYGAVLSIDLATGATKIWSDDPRASARLAEAWRQTEYASLPDPHALETESSTDEAAHRAALQTVKDAIYAGDVYLVNVARMVHARAGLDPEQVATRVAASRATYAALLDAGDTLVGGMSMELALAWDRASRALETRPIKGTRPRATEPLEDARLAAELATDTKERAENAMAVDVHRNDLARVSELGSVVVPSLCAVEPHAFVHHLVSTVRARARADVTTRAVLAATLPVGSVTGAPKRTAMQTIARVERERRGLYTGAYGAVGRDGSLTLAVAIRTIVVDADGAHYGAGGGIVLDSVPAREWDELRWKEGALAAGRAQRN